VVDAQVRAHSAPKSTCKLFSAISDNIVWDAMFPDNLLEEDPCQLRRVDIFLPGQLDHSLSQSDNDYKDPSIPQCCRLQ